MSADPYPVTIPRISTPKRVAATVAHYSLASELLSKLSGWSRGWPRIRAINYHQTVQANAASFEAHLRYYQKLYSPVTHDDLIGVLERGQWRHAKPGLLISFDDGSRNNYDIAAPLLEKYGFVGWFFAPTGFIECPVDQQKAFAHRNEIYAALVDAPPDDPRVAMTWDELRDLRRRGHFVGVHTMNHRRMSAKLNEQELHTEIVESRAIMNERLGGGIDSFCWVGGEEGAYSSSAARCVARTGYRLGFMTNSDLITKHTHPLQLNRTNVEDRWPLSVVTMLLSGLMDLRFAKYRKRMNELTRVEPQPA